MDKIYSQVSAYVYYYGVIHIKDLYPLLKKSLGKHMTQITLTKLKQILLTEANNPASLYDFELAGDFIRYFTLDDYHSVLEKQSTRALEYRPVSPREVELINQCCDEELWGEATQRFCDWIKQKGSFDSETATDITIGYVEAMRFDCDIAELIESISEQFALDNLGELHAVVDIVTGVINEIPRWELKGWSSKEVYQKHDKPILKPIQDSLFDLQPEKHSPAANTESSTVINVGRNDPCPCGSGKKFKKCCLNKIIDNTIDEINGMINENKMNDIPTVEYLGAVTDEAMQALLETFIHFTTMKPWQWISGSELFAVELPQGETHYAAILGFEGEVFGLVVYLGSQGLQLHTKQSHPYYSTQIDLHEMGPQLLLSLGNKEELDPAEARLYAQLGYKFRGRNSWPVFRKTIPGHYPWKLEQQDVILATTMLSQATEMAAHCRKHRRQWTNRVFKKSQMAICKAGQTAEDLEKRLRWIPYPAYEPEPLLYDQIRAVRLAKSLPYSDFAWEMDSFYDDIPIQEKPKEVPWFPLYTVIGEAHTGIVIKYEIDNFYSCQPDKTFLDLVEKMGYLPSNLIFSNPSKANLLQPLCQQMGLKVRLADKLQIDEFKQQILSGLSRGRSS